jgi:hypothetical protein
MVNCTEFKVQFEIVTLKLQVNDRPLHTGNQEVSSKQCVVRVLRKMCNLTAWTLHCIYTQSTYDSKFGVRNVETCSTRGKLITFQNNSAYLTMYGQKAVTQCTHNMLFSVDLGTSSRI